MSKKLDLDSMSVDEMWQLHGRIGQILSARLTSEKRELEKRIEQLRCDKHAPLRSANGTKDLAGAPRRRYPRVYPKYQNPEVLSETWSGRGKTPRWLVSALNSGRRLEEFAISSPVGILVRKQKGTASRAR